jgi:hypothetical protein
VLSTFARLCHSRRMLISSGDIAEATGRTTGAVRAWERKGKIPKGARGDGNMQRRWDANEIAPILAKWGFKIPAAWGVAVDVVAA